MDRNNPPHPGEFIAAVYLEAGRSPESWLAMQSNHDLWQARQDVKIGNVGRAKLTAR